MDSTWGAGHGVAGSTAFRADWLGLPLMVGGFFESPLAELVSPRYGKLAANVQEQVNFKLPGATEAFSAPASRARHRLRRV